jgi:transposase
LGESQRAIARSQRVGRPSVGAIERIAAQHGWLDPAVPIPEDAALAAALKKPRTAPQDVSSVEPFRERILAWHAQAIQATTIRQALARAHAYTGSVGAIYRFLDREVPSRPSATLMLEFALAEMAQVDFGSGPLITDRRSGEAIKTWIFVMTLAWSRHQYAQIVRNQSVETWLACHRHGFEWFDGVPRKIRIDNPQCAIQRACYYEPTVQRAYGDLALGYGFLIDPCPVRDPAKKGRVEAGVEYVEASFVPLREFHSLVQGNEPLRAWILGEAGGRSHGSTRSSALPRPNRPCSDGCRRSLRSAPLGPRRSCMATATSSSNTVTTRRRFG